MANSPDWSPLPAGVSVPSPEEVPLDDLPFVRHPYKIAGALMLANLVMVLAERLVLPSEGALGGSPVALIFDLIIGGSLLTGQARWRIWAIVRAVLGLLVILGVGIAGGDLCSPVVAVFWVGGLVNLLVGRAGGVRILLSLAGFGVYALVEVVGLALAASGVI